MGIYIKGMKMPTRCDDCVMGHELAVGTSVTGYGCLAMLRMGDARIRPISCGTKPDWCPLVEVPPHGRLIGADAMNEKYGDWYTEEGTEEGFIGTLKYLIAEQPTIIESEDGT